MLTQFLPSRDIKKPIFPIIEIILGGISKYVWVNPVTDLLGHLVIFVGTLNLYYYLIRGKSEKIPTLVGLIVVLVMFLGIQIILIELSRLIK